jgi:hypothetical protein
MSPWRRAGVAWRRMLDLLDAVVAGPRPALRLLRLTLAAALIWWLYVPLHELAHAGGCLSCGGEVRRMTLAPVYGGAIAARHFDWIDDATPYAGQLADFTTGGSDLCYLWLVLAPFVATPLARPLLRRAGRTSAALPFAAGLILATAPLMSITGDFYEAASIVVTRAAGLPAAGALRTDDLGALVARLAVPGAGTTPFAWSLVALSALIGAAAAVALTVSAIPPMDTVHAAPKTERGAAGL